MLVSRPYSRIGFTKISISRHFFNLSERPQIVECSMKNCSRMFATTKEMNWHVRTDHDVTTMESELDPEMIVIPITTLLCCPLSGCNKSYKTVGWWKAHMRNAHPQLSGK